MGERGNNQDFEKCPKEQLSCSDQKLGSHILCWLWLESWEEDEDSFTENLSSLGGNEVSI